MKRNDLCIQWSFGKKKEVAHDNDCRAVARQLIAMHSQPTFAYIYICPSRFGPLGPPRDSKWRLLLFCGRRFRSCSARRVIDMDKSTTSNLEERLTAAPRLVQFV